MILSFSEPVKHKDKVESFCKLTLANCCISEDFFRRNP